MMNVNLHYHPVSTAGGYAEAYKYIYMVEKWVKAAKNAL
jgi:hypothetical protein